MRDIGIDLLMQLGGLALFSTLAGVLGVAGLFLEYQSLVYLSSGETQLALWVGALGIVVLVGAIKVLKEKVLGGLSPSNQPAEQPS